MRVIIDKLQTPPPHALTRHDVTALMRLVKGWELTLFHTVHLRATLPEKAHQITNYRFADGGHYHLDVNCRGIAPQEARLKMLRRLAIVHLRLRNEWPLTVNQERTVMEMVEPVLQAAEAEAQARASAVMPAFAPPRPPAGEGVGE